MSDLPQNLPQTSVLRLERQGWKLFATIDDPATRNAMSDRLADDLEAVLEATEADRTLRALVLQGANGAFCAGADLAGAAAALKREPAGRDDDPIWSQNRRGGALFARLNACPQAVIVVVDGPAMGGGLGLVCCADVVLAGANARFALSETSLGLVPAQIAPFVIARIGLAAARRLALTGARLDARGAQAIGLADQALETPDALAGALNAVLADIARCAPNANAATKRLLLSAARSVPDGFAPDSFADAAADAFTAAIRGPEGREGLAAFAARRAPQWATQGAADT